MCEIAEQTIPEPIYEVERGEKFKKWLLAVKDFNLLSQVTARIDRASGGDFGDCKMVGGGVSEMRIHYGGGYRLYYTIKGRKVIFMLLGGGKKTQKSDIKKAIKIAEEN